MKNCILFFISILIAGSAFSQNIDDPKPIDNPTKSKLKFGICVSASYPVTIQNSPTNISWSGIVPKAEFLIFDPRGLVHRFGRAAHVFLLHRPIARQRPKRCWAASLRHGARRTRRRLDARRRRLARGAAKVCALARATRPARWWSWWPREIRAWPPGQTKTCRCCGAAQTERAH